jgi:hypothetical protein
LGWKHFVKRTGHRLAPRLTTAVLSSRARAHSASLVKQWGLFDLNQKLIKEVGRQVVRGPFAGMTLTQHAEQQHVGPYLLGTYEMELHGWVEECSGRTFTEIVDIGSSFGYYAVGLARRFPRTPVIAFDTDWWARSAVAELAKANGASNVIVRRECTPAWLETHLKPSSLIVSDCEGYERVLFLGRRLPALATATLIVELHEETPGELTEKFRQRFSETHTIAEACGRTTTPLVQGIHGLTPAQIERVSHEVRGPQAWLYLRPLTLPGAS